MNTRAFRALVRNMAIGAVLASSRALILLANSSSAGRPEHRAFLAEAAITLGAAGAVAGAVFTALSPLRRRSSRGHYLGGILTVYVILAIVVAVGIAHGDDVALLKEPAISSSFLARAPLQGYSAPALRVGGRRAMSREGR